MYVVGEKCLGCRFSDCVAVCPVKDCFKLGANMVVIDPNLCIDCGLCAQVCPAEAISHDLESQLQWIEHNAKYAKIWPAINEMIEPMEHAQENISKENKAQIFDSTKGIGQK